MSASRPIQTSAGYTVGADLCAPFAVVLTIDTSQVDAEKFRADLPRIAAKLEAYIIEAREGGSAEQATLSVMLPRCVCPLPLRWCGRSLCWRPNVPPRPCRREHRRRGGSSGAAS